MKTTANIGTVDVLNDLIEINNDRIEGYEKAIRDIDNSDVDLKAIFSKMADESRGYVHELTNQISQLGGDTETGTTVSGKVYRAWMDVKSTFTGSNRTSVLELCEFGEDAAQKAYNAALATSQELPTNTRLLIAQQQAKLKSAHDTIKHYGDLNKSLSQV